MLDILADTHGFEGDFAHQLGFWMSDGDSNKFGVSFVFEYTKYRFKKSVLNVLSRSHWLKLCFRQSLLSKLITQFNPTFPVCGHIGYFSPLNLRHPKTVNASKVLRLKSFPLLVLFIGQHWMVDNPTVA